MKKQILIALKKNIMNKSIYAILFTLIIALINSLNAFSQANKSAPKIDTSVKIDIPLVLIKGGTFVMGSQLDELGRKSDESPHSATIIDYYIGRTEVTQAQWIAIMGNNPSFNKGNNLPVESVSWDDIQVFLSKLNAITGKKYRLPTEAEWEYACRAQSSTPFNTGDKLTFFHANFDAGVSIDTSKKCSCHSHVCENEKNKAHAEPNNNIHLFRGRTMPVGSFKPNAWGIYDMHGNVQEWCNDFYNINSSNPDTSTQSIYRVVKGGGWNDRQLNCRSASRSYFHQTNKNRLMGFRLAASK